MVGQTSTRQRHERKHDMVVILMCVNMDMHLSVKRDTPAVLKWIIFKREPAMNKSLVHGLSSSVRFFDLLKQVVMTNPGNGLAVAEMCGFDGGLWAPLSNMCGQWHQEIMFKHDPIASSITKPCKSQPYSFNQCKWGLPCLCQDLVIQEVEGSHFQSRQIHNYQHLEDDVSTISKHC